MMVTSILFALLGLVLFSLLCDTMIPYHHYTYGAATQYFQLLIPPKRFDIFSPRLGDAQKV